MTKAEIMKELSDKTGVTKKDAEAVVGALVNLITETVAAGDKITIVGMGTFESVDVKERVGTIMMGDRKGEQYVTPAHKSVKFKAAKALKEAVNR